MAPLKHLLSLAKRWISPKPAALENSALSKLSLEILIHIAGFLPAASAASYALCCTQLYTLLEIPYLKCKCGYHVPFELSELLSLLERDLRDYIACYHCQKLHIIKADKKHTLINTRCDITVCQRMTKYTHYNFSYVVFQMAMKRYYQGVDNRSLLKLLHYDEITSTRDSQVNSSMRIANSTLVNRKRWIFIAHRGNDGLFSNRGVIICPHIAAVRGRFIFLNSSRVEYRMFYKIDGKEVEVGPGVEKRDCGAYSRVRDISITCSGLIQCKYCATEFRVDSMAVGKRKMGRAFIITRWKDLGRGDSVDDPTWSAHVTEEVMVRTRFMPGSICAAFEGEGEVRLSSLLTQKEQSRLLKFKC